VAIGDEREPPFGLARASSMTVSWAVHNWVIWCRVPANVQ
jgi:hypothetical protein